MLNPSVVDLLTGVADALEADVLGELEAGPAREQLQAAIAIVRRVARTLPGYTASLLEDIEDLRATLDELGLEIDGELGAGDERVERDGRVPLDVLLAEDLRLRATLAAAIESAPLDGAADAALRVALARLNEREAALRQSPWER